MHQQSLLVLAQATAADDKPGLGFIAWIVVGIIAGFLGSKIVNKRGEGLIRDLLLGLIGAVVGGFLFRLIGVGAGGFIFSIVVATIGAIVVLVLYHKVIGRKS